MNLVQKLPIGLGLACLMILSSCSKEDASAPQPQVGGVNESSNLKTADGFDVLPQFPTTYGPTGLNILAPHWNRETGYFAGDLQTFPAGTSSLTHLWGNLTKKWAKSLLPVPGAANPNSILTITTSASDWLEPNKSSAIFAKIKFLKPGKKYAVTVYVSTTSLQEANTIVPVYAKQAMLTLSQTYSGGSGGSIAYYVDMKNSKTNWVSKTIEFTAESGEAELRFSALTAQENQIAYAHIFVDKNSIKQIK